MLPKNTDVVVVGGGPTGLVTTAVLRKRGVDVVTLDRESSGASTSRASAVHAHTLEVLEDLEVSDQIVEEGVVVPEFTFRDRDRVLTRLDFTHLPTRYPFVVTLQQWRTEEIIAKRLAELGGEIHRPYTVTEVVLGAAGAGADVRVDGPDGRETIHARYVVGADGVHSVVRDASGIEFPGGDYPQSFVLADAHLDWPLARAEVQNFFSPAGIVVSGPLPQGQRRVLATMDQAPEEITVDVVQEILDRRGPTGAAVHELTWTSQFHVHHRIADSFTRGPIALAGDAAHVHSPAGGQGMNLGIQDGHDLANTLAVALRHGADHQLAAYEQRRRPVARATVAFTNFMTSASVATAAPARAARNSAFSLIGHLPPARRQMALHMAELA